MEKYRRRFFSSLFLFPLALHKVYTVKSKYRRLNLYKLSRLNNQLAKQPQWFEAYDGFAIGTWLDFYTQFIWKIILFFASIYTTVCFRMILLFSRCDVNVMLFFWMYMSIALRLRHVYRLPCLYWNRTAIVESSWCCPRWNVQQQ